MIITELFILEAVFLLVLAHSAWRRDRRDGPLAILIGYDLASSLGILGFTELWSHLQQRSLILRFGLGWPVDLLFVACYASVWAVAFRYHKDRWPARLGLHAASLAGALLLVTIIHAVQRLYFGLGSWDVGVRWVVLNGACLLYAVLAGWHLAQVFRTREVALAHLVSGCYVVISIIQFLLALRPWDWDISLFRLASLTFMMVSLVIYGVRLVRFGQRNISPPKG